MCITLIRCGRNCVKFVAATQHWFLAALGSWFGPVAVFLVTRFYISLHLVPAYSDVPLYLVFGIGGVDFQHPPYGEALHCEYPPAAFHHFYTIRSAADDRLPRTTEAAERPRRVVAEMLQDRRNPQYRDFAARYRKSLVLVDLLAVLVLLSAVRRRYGRAEALLFAWAYVLGTACLGHLLYDRTDLVLMLFFAIWAAAWQRLIEIKRHASSFSGDKVGAQLTAYAAIGCGIAYKLIPLLVAPFMLLAEWHEIRRRSDGGGGAWLRAGLSLGVLLLTGAAPFIYYLYQSGNDIAKIFRYHLGRPVECESVGASLLLVAKWLGMQLSIVHSFGSMNLEGPYSNVVNYGARFLMLGGLGLLGLISVLRLQQFDRQAAYRASLAAILYAAVTSTVLSPQYLLWILPILGLAMLETGNDLLKRILIPITTLIAILTTFVFPYHFFSPAAALGNLPGYIYAQWGVYPNLHWIPCAALVLRNLILTGTIATVLYVFSTNRDAAKTARGHHSS